jgi:hypothetical protein
MSLDIKIHDVEMTGHLRAAAWAESPAARGN